MNIASDGGWLRGGVPILDPGLLDADFSVADLALPLRIDSTMSADLPAADSRLKTHYHELPPIGETVNDEDAPTGWVKIMQRQPHGRLWHIVRIPWAEWNRQQEQQVTNRRD